MKFSEFIGNKSIADTIKNSFAKGRIAHAYLFAGPEGMGKRYLATIAAATLLCKNGGEEACGQCSSCQKIGSFLQGEGFHPDFNILEPDGKFIKVEQMRKHLISATQMQPHESKHQVFIVDPAEKMHPSAANAFLKTLEEGPGHSVFFLISQNPVSLLPTIKSRCQKFNFHRMPPEELQAELIRLKAIPQDEAVTITSLSRGAIGSALNFDLDAHLQEREIALEFVRLILSEGRIEDIFSLSGKIVKENDRFAARLEMAITLLRDIMMIASGGISSPVVSSDIKEELLDMAKGRSPKMIAEMISYISEMYEPLVRNVRVDSVSEQIMLTGRRKFKVKKSS